jgi:hypothetical protein
MYAHTSPAGEIKRGSESESLRMVVRTASMAKAEFMTISAADSSLFG